MADVASANKMKRRQGTRGYAIIGCGFSYRRDGRSRWQPYKRLELTLRRTQLKLCEHVNGPGRRFRRVSVVTLGRY